MESSCARCHACARHRWLRRFARLLLASIVITHFAPSALADVAPLSVRGNRIYAGEQPASFAGNSLFWSNNGWGGEKYYNADVVRWLKTDWRSPLVRAAMGVDESGGYLQDPAANRAKVRAVVEAAIANDMYVIIDWHSHHAHQYRNEAIAFFQDMARTYGHRNHVIYEIYNEPLQISWSGEIKPYAQAVVNAIRAIDPDNLIVVGTPTWSQDVEVAAADPIAGTNIAYTLHFYAGTHGQFLRDKAQRALDRNVALFVTEWGSVNADGNGAVNESATLAWMDFLKARGISHANWAINDKVEGASALVAGASASGGWTDAQLTPSGRLSKRIIQEWGGSTQPPPPPPPCAAASVGITIQAESWCAMSGVQTESTQDSGGGLNVGWIDRGDWMTYRINVPSAGTYRVSYRVASQPGGGVIQLERQGGTPIFGTLNVPQTGSWQTWRTISHDVNLPAGEQSIALVALAGGYNVNWLRLDTLTSDPTQPLATVQAESFSQMSGIQTEPTQDSGGGLNVGWIDAGDWFSYMNTPIDIPTSGNYRIEYRVASLNGGGDLNLEEAGGTPVHGRIAIPRTGGWQQWTTISHTLFLSAGTHRFGIKANAGGWNLNWFRIVRAN